MLPVTSSHVTQLTHYEIMGISPRMLNEMQDPNPALKRAYRRALLKYHPDKANTQEQRHQTATSSHNHQRSAHPNPPSLTIDQITLAFTILSSPRQRAEYNEDLHRQQQLPTSSSLVDPAATIFQTGIDPVDLDDLSFDESTSQWFRGCRCGNLRAYVFGHADLEEVLSATSGCNGGEGELLVECLDCSLWLKVHFAVAED